MESISSSLAIALMVLAPFFLWAVCVLPLFLRFAGGHVGGRGQLQHHGEGAEAAFQHAERGRGPLGESQPQNHLHVAAFRVENFVPSFVTSSLSCLKTPVPFSFFHLQKEVTDTVLNAI